jgi:glycosyltransferase involved in cell wall biosynthesis
MKATNPSINVSVIIPVYNTEEFVQEAVDSVRRQTLQELEIIVVNDGSTDGSLRIVEQLAKEDSRIRVFSQTNQGQSVARNNAMKQAGGKYLYFMDSDDVIAPETLRACFCKCEKENLDFVFFDAEILNKESRLAMSLAYDRSKGVSDAEVQTGATMLQKQLQTRCYTPSPCLSLIRTDFLRRHEISFYPGIIHEDELFSALLYLHAQRVMYVRQTFFKRRFREDSTMTRRYSWRNMEGYLTVSGELIHFRKHKASREQRTLVDSLLGQMLDAAVWNAHSLPVRQRLDLFRLCLQKRYTRYVSSRTIATMLAKSIVR